MGLSLYIFVLALFPFLKRCFLLGFAGVFWAREMGLAGMLPPDKAQVHSLGFGYGIGRFICRQTDFYE